MFLLFLLVGPIASAQIESGTVIVIGYSKQKVVIAADSRESTPEGMYRDNARKITALNDKLIFFASGRAKLTNGNDVIWDASREAVTALSDTVQLPEDSNGAFIDRVASRWGRIIGNSLASHMGPKDALALTNDELLLDSVFVGVDEQGKIHIAHEAITAKVSDDARNIDIKPVGVAKLQETMEFIVMSESDIFDEFTLGQSQRSKRWRHELSQFGKRCGISDPDAAKSIYLVKLTGKYGKERVPNNPTVHLVGGPTLAAELQQGNAVKWIQIKPGCQDNRDEKAPSRKLP